MLLEKRNVREKNINMHILIFFSSSMLHVLTQQTQLIKSNRKKVSIPEVYKIKQKHNGSHTR